MYRRVFALSFFAMHRMRFHYFFAFFPKWLQHCAVVRQGAHDYVQCRDAASTATRENLLNKDLGKKLMPWLGNDSSKKGKNQWGLPPRRPQPQDPNKRWVTVLMLLTVFSSWLMSGVFVLPENQQAMVSRLGEFHHMAGPGVNWILPYPIERYEILTQSETGTVEIGESHAATGSGMPNAAMFTKDAAIVEVRLIAQYRLRNVRDYLQTQGGDAEQILRQMGSASVREVLAQMDFSDVLGSAREQIAPRVQKHLQALLNASGMGIELLAVKGDAATMVRVPDALRASFEEVNTLGAENERLKKEALEHASRVVPEAAAKAVKLHAAAQAYKTDIVLQAQADAARIAAILPQYQKTPQATRDQLYHETMQQVFANATKVVASPGQIVYLSADRAAQTVAPATVAATGATAPSDASIALGASGETALPPIVAATSASAATQAASQPAAQPDSRSREFLSLRQRR